MMMPLASLRLRPCFMIRPLGKFSPIDGPDLPKGPICALTVPPGRAGAAKGARLEPTSFADTCCPATATGDESRVAPPTLFDGDDWEKYGTRWIDAGARLIRNVMDCGLSNDRHTGVPVAGQCLH